MIEVKKDGVEGEIIEELKNLKFEIEELKKKVGWMEPVVKGRSARKNRRDDIGNLKKK